MINLIPAHGGKLINLIAEPTRAVELEVIPRDLTLLTLSPRQLCDLELLLAGGFSPLRGFMGRADYESVCTSMRLADGTLWPCQLPWT
jgi:sulfate adenylyltransferase